MTLDLVLAGTALLLALALRETTRAGRLREEEKLERARLRRAEVELEALLARAAKKVGFRT